MINGIGEKTIEALKAQVSDLIDTHKNKIQQAFLQAEEGKMKIGLGINIAQVGSKLMLETQITYVVEKISDKQSGFVDENQHTLFPVSQK